MTRTGLQGHNRRCVHSSPLPYEHSNNYHVDYGQSQNRHMGQTTYKGVGALLPPALALTWLSCSKLGSQENLPRVDPHASRCRTALTTDTEPSISRLLLP